MGEGEGRWKESERSPSRCGATRDEQPPTGTVPQPVGRAAGPPVWGTSRPPVNSPSTIDGMRLPPLRQVPTRATGAHKGSKRRRRQGGGRVNQEGEEPARRHDGGNGRRARERQTIDSPRHAAHGCKRGVDHREDVHVHNHVRPSAANRRLPRASTGDAVRARRESGGRPRGRTEENAELEWNTHDDDGDPRWASPCWYICTLESI